MGIALPKDSPEAAEQVTLASWLARSDESIRLAQDERLEVKTRLQVGSWFVAGCEAISQNRTLAVEVEQGNGRPLEEVINRQSDTVLANEANQGPLNPVDIRMIRMAP